MKEITVLQCSRCFTHTPLIETDNQESIIEAIKRHSRCDNCGRYAMLCYESKPVMNSKPKKLSWRSANTESRGKTKPTGRRRLQIVAAN